MTEQVETDISIRTPEYDRDAQISFLIGQIIRGQGVTWQPLSNDLCYLSIDINTPRLRPAGRDYDQV